LAQAKQSGKISQRSRAKVIGFSNYILQGGLFEAQDLPEALMSPVQQAFAPIQGANAGFVKRAEQPAPPQVPQRGSQHAVPLRMPVAQVGSFVQSGPLPPGPPNHSEGFQLAPPSVVTVDE